MIMCQGGTFPETARNIARHECILDAVPHYAVIKLLSLLHEGMAMHGKGGAGERGGGSPAGSAVDPLDALRDVLQLALQALEEVSQLPVHSAHGLPTATARR